MLPKNYEAPTLTLECVLFQVIDGKLAVLIGKISGERYRGQWALPGSFCSKGETTREALDRIMRQKAGIEVDGLGLVEQVHTFDTIETDGRGHAVDIVFLGVGKDLELDIDDEVTKVSTPYFAPVYDLPPLAYDHGTFIDFALKRLRSLLNSSNAAAALMPDLFTLTSLQKAYEAVLGRSLDKRNFRKRILAYNILEATDEWKTDGAHPKARYYKFRESQIRNLEREF